LVAKHDGRDIASIYAFCDAADALSKTVVIAETENGESICGGYLDPAWREGTSYDNRKSFLFTLKNHLGVAPTKFPKKDRDSWAAYRKRGNYWHFVWEGPYVWQGGNPRHDGLGRFCQGVVGQGQAIFNGGQDFFRLARWELWQIA
jgi:hypothetical protein